jgi:hypothetical protein
MILRIWAGSAMTAMSDILLPQRGQAMTSSSWTLTSSRANAFLRERTPISWPFGASESAGSAPSSLPYQAAGARDLRAGRSFQVPRDREE